MLFQGDIIEVLLDMAQRAVWPVDTGQGAFKVSLEAEFEASQEVLPEELLALPELLCELEVPMHAILFLTPLRGSG